MSFCYLKEQFWRFYEFFSTTKKVNEGQIDRERELNITEL